jgi:HSP20 family protein
MSMTTWSPMREIETLRERMDKIFSEMSVRPRMAVDQEFLPLDVQETDTQIIVKASMPGFKTEDLNIEVNRGMLTIRGETKEEREETKGTWHLQERRFGSVQRAVRLPAAVYEDEAKATLENGVLTVTLPKSESTPTRKIEIEAK